MRGKIACPFTRSGAEDAAGGTGVGAWLPGPVEPGETFGGSAGFVMNGAREEVELVVSAGAGVTVAESDVGQGSVLNEPLSSAFVPFRKRATTR
jgi:hypothetical protein